MKKETTPAGWVYISTATFFSIIAVVGVHIWFYEPASVPEPDPVIIEVDGINCVIAEMPTLTYYVTTDSVRVTIECDSDILMHYLPAIPVGAEHE